MNVQKKHRNSDRWELHRFHCEDVHRRPIIHVQNGFDNVSAALPISSDMPLPNVTIHISGSVLAVYGAVLSTITATVQIITHLRDRAHLHIRVQHNMEMVGDPRYAQKDLTIMYVVNAGRRPVTITGVGAYRLSPHNAFIIPDTRPQCPCELTEGKQLTAIIDQKQLDLSLMESWEAYTAAGGTYRLAIIPWYRRWRNRRALRRVAMKEAKPNGD